MHHYFYDFNRLVFISLIMYYTESKQNIKDRLEYSYDFVRNNLLWHIFIRDRTLDMTTIININLIIQFLNMTKFRHHSIMLLSKTQLRGGIYPILNKPRTFYRRPVVFSLYDRCSYYIFLGPNSFISWSNLSQVKSSQGHYADSLVAAQKSIEICPYWAKVK